MKKRNDPRIRLFLKAAYITSFDMGGEEKNRGNGACVRAYVRDWRSALVCRVKGLITLNLGRGTLSYYGRQQFFEGEKTKSGTEFVLWGSARRCGKKWEGYWEGEQAEN